MTRSEAIKALFFKSVLPVTVALILYCIFKSACMKNGELDYVWLWILCGLPFGLHRMCLWIVPADRWMIFLRYGNMENCRSCR